MGSPESFFPSHFSDCNVDEKSLGKMSSCLSLARNLVHLVGVLVCRTLPAGHEEKQSKPNENHPVSKLQGTGQIRLQHIHGEKYSL